MTPISPQADFKPAPNKHTTMDVVASGYSAKNDFEVHASKYADESALSSFVQLCRSFLSFIGVSDTHKEITQDEQNGFVTIAREIVKESTNITTNTEKGSRALKTSSMHFIEMPEGNETFVWIKDANGVLKIPTPMKLEDIVTKAETTADKFKDILFPEKEESIDLTNPYSTVELWFKSKLNWRAIG